MKVVFTEPALDDLTAIRSFLQRNCPTISASVEARIRAVIDRIAMWPQSARRVDGRPGVRVVIRYPYTIFYRINGDVIEVLHIHHAARDENV